MNLWIAGISSHLPSDGDFCLVRCQAGYVDIAIRPQVDVTLARYRAAAAIALRVRTRPGDVSPIDDRLRLQSFGGNKLRLMMEGSG